jgi:hypothetical protein
MVAKLWRVKVMVLRRALVFGVHGHSSSVRIYCGGTKGFTSISLNLQGGQYRTFKSVCEYLLLELLFAAYFLDQEDRFHNIELIV